MWHVASTALIIVVIAALALLVWLNVGRAVPSVTTTPTALPTRAPLAAGAVSPTPRATPRALASPTPAASVEPTAQPTDQPATPTPHPQNGVIANTGGAGVTVRAEPGPQATALGSLRDGATVILTGNQQTVAARPWVEIQSTQQNLKGWVAQDFVTVTPSQP